MRVVIVLLAACVLAGCQSTKPVTEMSYSELKTLGGQLEQRCIDQGVKVGTPEMSQCKGVEINREVVMRQNARIRQANGIAAAQMAFQNASNAYAAQAQQNRTLNCRTNYMNGISTTSCY